MKKEVKIIIVFCLLLLAIPVIAFLGRTHITKNYLASNYKIKETYFFKDRFYQIIINDKYFINIQGKRKDRKLVTQVTKKGNCYNIKTLIKNYSLCKDKTSFKVGATKEVKSKMISLEGINVAKDITETLIYWDYHDLNIIKSNKLKKINLTTEDYSFKGAYLYQNKFLYLHPNINTYDQLKIVNIDNNKLTTIDLNDYLSIEAYYLGAHQNLVYIYDPDNVKL